jgi:hypothetical protein
MYGESDNLKATGPSTFKRTNAHSSEPGTAMSSKAPTYCQSPNVNMAESLEIRQHKKDRK